MSEVVEWYAPGLASRTFSCACGWSGRLSEMSPAPYAELAEHSCPSCDTTLVLREYPTPDDVREAAARGDADAISDLPKYEAMEERRDRARSSELASIEQLPALDLAEPTVFVWDVEEHDGDHWAVVRIAGSGHEVWREMAYWEGWPRAVAVRELLAARYGDGFGGLVGTYQGVTWLAGDSNHLTLERASDADAPWVGE